MRDDREKLRDILEAIERIERYAIQGRQSFEEDDATHHSPSSLSPLSVANLK